jgi:hypothetical protein
MFYSFYYLRDRRHNNNPIYTFASEQHCNAIMELERLMCLDRYQLEEMISKLNVECSTRNCEDDELQALLYSYIAPYNYFDKAYELCCLFDEPFELIHSLIESSEGKLTAVVLDAMMEIKTKPVEMVTIATPTQLSVVKKKVNRGVSFVLIEDETDNAAAGHFEVSIKSSGCKDSAAVFSATSFGHHDFDIVQSSLKIQRPHQVISRYNIFASSAIYSYCMSLNAVLDRLFWGWEGTWDAVLEATLLELLVAVDSDLVPVVLRMNDMMGGMMGAGAGKELEALLTSVQGDLAAALTTHSPYAMGRLHQTTLELRDLNSGPMGSMFNLPESLIRAIDGFIQTKIQKSPQHLLSREINALVSVGTMCLCFDAMHDYS